MPELNQQELAARYGWSLAVLNSSPDLANLFSQAVAGTWTAEKFTAELRNTNWFKQNGEAARQAQILRSSDPATWEQRVNNQIGTVTMLASQLGAVVSPGVIRQMAENTLTYGWNDNNLRGALGSYVRFQGGTMWGQAQENTVDLRKYAASMGVRVSGTDVENWVKAIAVSGGTTDAAKATIAQIAGSSFPQFRERFEAGETLDEIASPYKQSMATLLELSPEAIDNFDPTIRGALSGKDPKTNQPATKTIWEFENDLRKDQRWLKTGNARDSVMSATRQVLKDFGLQT